MLHGHSDAAIDFYASAYCRELLDAARPTRFSRERITYSNDIFTGFRTASLPATVDAYEGLRHADGERLLGEGTRLLSVRSKGGPPPEGAGEGLVHALGSNGVVQELTTSPIRKTAAAGKRGRRMWFGI